MVSTLIKNQYKVVKELPSGGFGKIYLAEDTHRPSHRLCVLKQLKPLTHNPQIYEIVKERFQQEASILEIIGEESDQIPKLYSYFEDAGLFYLAQEWIEGQTLAQWISASGPFEESTVRLVLGQILPILNHIHSRGIIHRDIKPDNIILQQKDRNPVLIDFGAVKQVMGTQINSQGQTTSTVVIGTPGYMPAEQAAGNPIFSSDLYSLGLTMIFLLTGKSPSDLMSNPQTGELVWHEHCSGISAGLTHVLNRVIRYSPRDRYATANEMLAALIQPAITEPMSPSPFEPTIRETVSFTTPSESRGPLNDEEIKGVQAPNAKKSFVGGLIGLGVVGALGIGGFFVFQPQSAYTQGISDLEKGDFRPAIAKFDQAIEDNSDNAAAYLKRGTAYNNVGNYEAAVEDFNTVLQADPKNAEAYLGRGQSRSSVGQYKEAIEDFTEVIQNNSADPQAFIARGAVRIVLGQYDEATSDFSQALALDSDKAAQAQVYGGLSSVQILQGQYEKAKDSLKKYINLDPDRIEAYAARGIFFRDVIGNKEKAYEDWENALKQTPITAADYLSLGIVRSYLGDKQGALNDYGRALQINPNLAGVYVAQGTLFNEQGNKQKAIDTTTKALKINPNATDAYMSRGNVRLYQGDQTDIQGGLEDINKALAINPKHFGALNLRCSIRTNLKDYEGAFSDCNKALGINPNFTSLYNQRALIRKAKEDLEGAIQDLSQGIKLNKNYGQEVRNGTLYSNRADTRFLAGDQKGALEDMNKAVELAPNAHHYSTRGQLQLILFDRDILPDLDGAKSDLQKAADLYLKDNRTQSYNSTITLLKKLESASPS